MYSEFMEYYFSRRFPQQLLPLDNIELIQSPSLCYFANCGGFLMRRVTVIGPYAPMYL